jgi:uncharacterized protein (TIGR02217 family)
MSFAIMPAMPLSMAKGLSKSPVFSTVTQKTAAARSNSSVSLMPFPTWAFSFDMDKITGNEAIPASVIALFLGTFMTCQGANQLFLFTDPQDNAVALTAGVMLNVTPGAASPMGVAGDGVSTQFQLARTVGGAKDIVQNLNGAAVIKVNGVTLTNITDYSISSTGVVTFVSAPANAATLQWSGSFYFLCRFSDDTVDATRVFTKNSGTDIWDISSIKFASEFV